MSSTLPAEDPLARYLEAVGRHPLLSPAEELRLAGLSASGDQTATRRLIESNLRLVVAIARRYRGRGLDLLDLIQEGNLGLIAAVERFDRHRGARLATYATWWIRRDICLALSTKGRLVRLPRRIAESGTRVQRADGELAQQLGRRPSPEDVARRAGVDAQTVVALRRSELTPVPLSDPQVAEAATSDEPADDERSPGVQAALSGLPARPRRILELRFGLDGEPPRTLAAVATELGVSRERVRYLEARALRGLATRPDVRALRAVA